LYHAIFFVFLRNKGIVVNSEKKIKLLEKKDIKIIINSPQFDRGFLKLSNKYTVKVEGEILQIIKCTNLKIKR